MKIIINTDTYLLSENESWHIFESPEDNTKICFDRDDYTLYSKVPLKLREKVMEEIIKALKENKSFIHVTTTSKIVVESK